jgi:hypothetical protein
MAEILMCCLQNEEGELMIRKRSCWCVGSWFPFAVLACCLVSISGCQGGERPYEIEVSDQHAPDFQEVYKVGLDEEFTLGESGYSAKVVRFVPDFRIDIETREVSSASQEMNNPAVLVEVYKDGAKAAEQWGFRKTMPHMGGATTFSFALLSVKGEGAADSYEPEGAESADPQMPNNAGSADPHPW